MSAPMNLSRKTRLLAAASIICLSLSTSSLAESATSTTRIQSSIGNRIDNSRVHDLAAGLNTEKESGEFNSLSPSSFTRDERKVVQGTRPDRLISLEMNAGSDAFASGQAVLLPSVRQRLENLADGLRGKQGLKFEIAGHTDNQRISDRLHATYSDNQALSEARADAIATYLTRLLDLPSGRISVRGFGDTQPIAPNATEKIGRAHV